MKAATSYSTSFVYLCCWVVERSDAGHCSRRAIPKDEMYDRTNRSVCLWPYLPIYLPTVVCNIWCDDYDVLALLSTV